jgi:hypothetical protein
MGGKILQIELTLERTVSEQKIQKILFSSQEQQHL